MCRREVGHLFLNVWGVLLWVSHWSLSFFAQVKIHFLVSNWFAEDTPLWGRSGCSCLRLLILTLPSSLLSWQQLNFSFPTVSLYWFWAYLFYTLVRELSIKLFYFFPLFNLLPSFIAYLYSLLSHLTRPNEHVMIGFNINYIAVITRQLLIGPKPSPRSKEPGGYLYLIFHLRQLPLGMFYTLNAVSIAVFFYHF